MQKKQFKNRLFGEFKENLQEDRNEFLLIGFSPRSIPIQKWWPNNGLSADFIANYLASFLPIQDRSKHSQKLRSRIKESVNYIANELLENSIKFSCKDADSPIHFGLYIIQENKLKIVLTTKNKLSQQSLINLQNFIENFLSAEPDSFYLHQLENSLEGDNQSGLGLISIQNDYNAKLGWKLEILESESMAATVTTMVQLEYDFVNP